MMLRSSIVAATLWAALWNSPTQAREPSCLEYEPAVVTLSGTISRHMHYGPPNYGEDPEHDEKGFYWYLDLDRPICVNGKNEDSPDMEGESDVRHVQIVYGVYADYPPGRGWIGRHVSITGSLFHADTVHHHTEVLIMARATVRTPSSR
jgi:hypothetical protein